MTTDPRADAIIFFSIVSCVLTEIVRSFQFIDCVPYLSAETFLHPQQLILSFNAAWTSINVSRLKRICLKRWRISQP
jgi:hypothetical protein